MESSKTLSETEREIARDAARGSLIQYARIIDPTYQVEWFHELIATKLQKSFHRAMIGKPTRLIIEMPPRHGKSQLATKLFPSWVLGKKPSTQIMTASYSSDLASDFGRETRDIIETPNYRDIFETRLRPDTKSVNKWATALADKENILKPTGGSYTATGIGGSITGRGFEIGLIDDPIKNRDEAESQTYRDKVWNWYKDVFWTRQNGLGSIILMLTRWHMDDLAGRLLDKAEKDPKAEQWEVLRIPAVADSDDQYRKKGEYLWLNRFSKDYYEKAEATLGPYGWNALYQQTPIASETQEFKPHWFKSVTKEYVMRLKTRKFATIDPAFTMNSTSDYTGVVRNYVDGENNWHISGQRYRIESPEIINLVFKLHEEGMEVIGIEEGAYMKAIKPFLDEEMKRRGQFPKVVPLKHGGRMKENRIRGLAPRYRAGSVFHIEGECKELEEELAAFPRSTYDDVMDAEAYQTDLAKSYIKQNKSYQPAHEPLSEWGG